MHSENEHLQPLPTADKRIRLVHLELRDLSLLLHVFLEHRNAQPQDPNSVLLLGKANGDEQGARVKVSHTVRPQPDHETLGRLLQVVRSEEKSARNGGKILPAKQQE